MTEPLPSWLPIQNGLYGWAVGSVAPYGAGYADPAFRFDPIENSVELRGLWVVTASFGAGGVPVVAPPKLAPTKGTEIFNVFSNFGVIRIDVLTTGSIIVQQAFTGGAGQWFSFTGIKWYLT